MVEARIPISRIGCGGYPRHRNQRLYFQNSSPCPAVATGDENGDHHPVLTRGVRLFSEQYAMPCGRHGG
jgi:hypothetical protein